MSIVARFQSEDEADKKYAFKYIFLSMVGIIFFISSAFLFFRGYYLIPSALLLVSVFLFAVKSVYADYCQSSKCKEPSTIDEYLNVINKSNDGAIARFFVKSRSLELFLSVTITLLIWMAFISLVIVYNANKSEDFTSYWYLVIFPLLSIIPILFYLINEDFKNNNIDYEPINIKLIKKSSSIIFENDNQRKSFFTSLDNQYRISPKMTREQLFRSVMSLKNKDDSSSIKDFLRNKMEE